MEFKPRTIVVLAIPMLALNVWCAVRLLHLNAQRVSIKEDYAAVNSIRNGLLSVDAWKVYIQGLAARKIEDFQLTAGQEAAFRADLEKALDALILQFDQIMRRKQKTLSGKIRKLAFKTFVDVNELRKNTPAFAQAVIKEIKKPANAQKLKDLALSQVNNIAEQTHDNLSDGPALRRTLAKYGVQTTQEFGSRADELVAEAERGIYANSAVMIASLFLFFCAWRLAWERKELHAPLFALSTAFALVLLLTGLSLPMIEVDARIKQVDFSLLGENLRFGNQMLYYRSKSIMQVVKIMMAAGRIDSMLVAVLVLVFSIMFPICKLACTQFYLFGGEKWKNNKLIYFFAFYSGKWSMADVTVVAIFMSYVGFKGVLNDQLKSLSVQMQSLTSISTSATSLQPGFILFLSFVLFGLMLSEILKKITQNPANIPARRELLGTRRRRESVPNI